MGGGFLFGLLQRVDTITMKNSEIVNPESWQRYEPLHTFKAIAPGIIFRQQRLLETSNFASLFTKIWTYFKMGCISNSYNLFISLLSWSCDLLLDWLAHTDVNMLRWMTSISSHVQSTINCVSTFTEAGTMELQGFCLNCIYTVWGRYELPMSIYLHYCQSWIQNYLWNRLS